MLFDANKIPCDDDFCKIEGYGSDCFIEATLKDCAAHSELVTDDEIRVRRVLKGRQSHWQFWGQTPISDTLKRMSEGSLTKVDFQNDEMLSAEIKASVNDTLKTLAPVGRVPKETWQAAFKHLETESLIAWENGWCSISSERLSSLVQVVILEADVRGEDEVTDASKSVFNRVGGMLLREATKRHSGMNQAVSELNSEIKKITTKNDSGEWPISEFNEFETILNEEVGRFDESVTTQSILVPPKVPAFEFSVKVEVSDGVVSGLDNMGHGLRRSIVFSMLRSHRRLRERRPPEDDGNNATPSPLYLFLIEEPELYLHPQAERRRKRELQELSELPDAQVILCTHSAFFIDLSEYKGVLRLHRQNRGVTQIQGWEGDELDPHDKKTLSTIYLFDPNRAAMLFADLVILVEGQCEKVAIPFLAESMNLDTHDVEVVDCGGNSSIPLYQRVLEGFGIKYVAWLDSDDKAPVKTARAVRKDYGKIILTPHNWERLNELGNPKEKTHRSWKHFVYEENPPNEKLEARIRAAYKWEDYELEPVKKAVST
jgi:CRISPR-associated exonuclease Cas4